MPDFGPEFEADVVAHSMRDPAFAGEAARVLRSHTFTARTNKWLWGLAQEAAARRERLTASIVAARAERDFPSPDDRAAAAEAAIALFERRVAAPQLALDEVTRFARFASLSRAMEDAAGALERNSVDDAWKRIRQCVDTDPARVDWRELQWFETFRERQAKRRHRRENPGEYLAVPTRIAKLDELTGGLEAGELGVVLGTTGRGKSIFAVHLGFAGIVSGYRVVHFTTEMHEDQVATRYDSRLLAVKYRDLKRYNLGRAELEQIEATLNRRTKELTDRMRIVRISVRETTPAALKRVLADLTARDWRPQLVIVDSADHLEADNPELYENHRLRQAAVYWGLASIAEDGYPVWTTTQAGKEWENRVAGSGATSESYDKARIASKIVSLNQTEEMRRYNEIDLFLTKNRDDEDKIHIPLATAFAIMLCKEKDQFESGGAARTREVKREWGRPEERADGGAY